MIKKGLAGAIALLLLLLPLTTGCNARREDDGLKIVCTVFPLYDWVKNIVGEHDAVEVSLLVKDGTDLHSYQPSAADMVSISSCDLLVCLGGGSEGWVEDALSRKPREGRAVLRLTEAEGVVLRQISDERLTEDCDEDCGEEHEHIHSHTGNETDEHIWLSLKNAQACTNAIAATLASLDETKAEQYRANAAAYTASLQEMDQAYAAAVAEVSDPKLIFADRFPFVYLTEDYGVSYLAAFRGCTTDTDATPDTVIRLAKGLTDWNLSAVTVTESSDRALAQGILRTAGRNEDAILVMDSMQSVTRKQIDEGTSYLAIMERNLSVFRQAITPTE